MSRSATFYLWNFALIIFLVVAGAMLSFCRTVMITAVLPFSQRKKCVPKNHSLKIYEFKLIRCQHPSFFPLKTVLPVPSNFPRVGFYSKIRINPTFLTHMQDRIFKRIHWIPAPTPPSDLKGHPHHQPYD